MNWGSILKFIVLFLFFIILILGLLITIIGMVFVIDAELQMGFGTSLKEIGNAIKNRKVERKERRNKKSK